MTAPRPGDIVEPRDLDLSAGAILELVDGRLVVVRLGAESWESRFSTALRVEGESCG